MTDKSTGRQELAEGSEPIRRIGPQIVTGAVLVLIGVLWLLQRLGLIELTVTTVLAIATIVVGVALIALSPGGSHTGLIVFGTVLAVVATFTAAGPLRGFQGGIGERVVEVSDSAELQSDYNLAMGNLVIDLTALGSLDGSEAFTASVGMGELRVRLPEGIPVSINGSAGAGELQLFERNANGLGVDLSFRSSGFDETEPGLTIDANVFMGRVEVTDG